MQWSHDTEPFSEIRVPEIVCSGTSDRIKPALRSRKANAARTTDALNGLMGRIIALRFHDLYVRLCNCCAAANFCAFVSLCLSFRSKVEPGSQHLECQCHYPKSGRGVFSTVAAVYDRRRCPCDIVGAHRAPLQQIRSGFLQKTPLPDTSN